MRESEEDSASALPEHIAIIMDGNGRWAKQQGKLRSFGHQAGFKAIRDIVGACVKRDVKALTIFAFSSENWGRPQQEIGLLMDLFTRALNSEVTKLHENNVRMRFIGERKAFSGKLQKQMRIAEEKTARNTGLEFAIAINYGGRWDIVNAAKNIAQQVCDNKLQVEDITIDSFSSHVTLSDVGDPDLFIRTGGEKRISNYLLWHLAYTELYFTDTLWPDFSSEELDKAMQAYSGRQRRFGRTGDQVETSKHA